MVCFMCGLISLLFMERWVFYVYFLDQLRASHWNTKRSGSRLNQNTPASTHMVFARNEPESTHVPCWLTDNICNTFNTSMYFTILKINSWCVTMVLKDVVAVQLLSRSTAHFLSGPMNTQNWFTPRWVRATANYYSEVIKDVTANADQLMSFCCRSLFYAVLSRSWRHIPNSKKIGKWNQCNEMFCSALFWYNNNYK